jgi:16S rRNA (adenine1518-N6/adenine1519-N6)-dimethyltransferase
VNVKAKKHLGQHFLTDENIAKKIANSLIISNYQKILEVGPGTGVLTKYLLAKPELDLCVAEIDTESIAYLQQFYPELQNYVGDFLQFDFKSIAGEQMGIIGNFPYNISSQIVFKIIDNYQQVPEMAGMFQKEVAERLAAKPSTKAYGIISVLAQCFYDIEYLFTVSENVFNPPPKVKSGVIRMLRNPKEGLAGIEVLLKQIVKAGFNQRRKTMRNALKVLGIPEGMVDHEFLSLRAEALSVHDFIKFSREWHDAKHNPTA